MAYQPNDHYARKAKKDNFAARSVYKLEEIDQKHRLLHTGDQVLDLGASPGSWSQYVAQKIGPKGRLLGIDLTPIGVHYANASFVTQDIYTADWPVLLAQAGMHSPVDVVLSDMAPATTGMRLTDHARSVALCQMALAVAQQHLKVGGHFVCKFFDGEDFASFKKELEAVFQHVKVLRPQSVRKESRELFFIGLQKRAA